MRPGTPLESTANRRAFLKSTAAGTTAAIGLEAAISTRAYAGEDNTIRIALVGCGGRGTGAAVNALQTTGPKRLVAMADLFPDRLRSSLEQLTPSHAADVDVPSDRQFLGMDAYKKAIDAVSPGGLVLLATPPAFRPLHVEYAIERGCHVFMEKSFGVDAPGVRRILKAGETARGKNLKIAGGLMSRHSVPLAQAIDQIHQGAIGEVITCYAYRMHGPVGFRPRSEGETEVEHQIRNYSCFTWLNGGFILDWLIHNLDVCCWVKGAWPESAQAQGGRQVRDAPDQMFDHMAVDYSFPDGTRLIAQGRHILECWDFFGDVIHGSTGCAVLGEGISDPKLYRGHRPDPDRVIWRYEGKPTNAYQVEHDHLFEAIRNDKHYNETERCAHAALTGILGRMAIESGTRITWEEALASNRVLAPGLDRLTLDGPAPVQPDPQGRYPIAMPGTTQVL